MKKYKVQLIAAMSAALVTTPQLVTAEENWYVAPALNYVIADKDRNADNNVGFSLGLGKKLSEKWNIEANFVMDKLDLSNGSASFDQKGIIVDGLYFLNRGNSLTPYFIVGAGILQTDHLTANSSNLTMNVGFGFEKQLSSSGMGLRGDVRYRLDNDKTSVSGKDRFEDLVVGLTLKVPFGGKSAMPVAAPVVSKPQVRIMDSDADGVIDSKDRCPSSAEGASVDAYGCEVIILKGVNFESNSSKLKASSTPVLDAAAETLIQRGDIKIQVAGHTDSQGAASYNQRLSAARANTVRSYLINKGVDAGNLSAKGYGEVNPITSNATSNGRATNRRVELRILQ